MYYAFARTRDGRHYAKFALLIEMEVSSPQGAPFEVLAGSEMIWAYQLDGTRNLEIAPGENLVFPVEEFGINRDSLGR